MNDAEIKLQVKIDDSKATSTVGSLNTKTSKLQSGFKSAGAMLGKAVLAGAVAAGAAITGLITAGVKYNAEIEQLTTSFEVMTGSAEKAVELTERLRKAGAETPYELQGLAKTTQTLMQYGLTADEAYDATLNFGDIAQGSADKMQSIALAYGQMSSAGKVNMQDIKQMINAGFNPLQAIVEMTGKSMKQVTAEYEDGKISVEDITKAMKFASSQGGKFYKSMEKQSKTLNGQISTLKDNFNAFAGALAGDVTGAITKTFLPALNDIMGEATNILGEGGIMALVKELPRLLKPIIKTLITSVLSMLTTGFKILVGLLPSIGQSLLDGLPMLLTTIIGMLPQLLQTVLTLTLMIIQSLAGMLPELIPQIIDAILAMIPILLDNLPLFIEAGLQLLIGLTIGILKAIPVLISYIPKIIKSLVKAFEGQFSAMWEVGKQLVAGLWAGISNSYTWIKSKITGWVGNVISFIKKLFGIKSPSKEFAIMGKYNVQGMIVGMDDMKSKLNKQMESTFGESLEYASNITPITPNYSMPNGEQVTNNFEIGNLNVRNESDINLIAEQLYYLQKKAVV